MEVPYETYNDILLERLGRNPDKVYTHLVKDDGEIFDITYRTLYEKSLGYAACMVHHQVERHDRVVVILPTCAEFLYSFYGCYLAGACPVPAYPPFRLYDIPAYVKNLAYILGNCQPKVVVAFSRAAEIIQSAIHHSGLKVPLLLDTDLEKFAAPSSFSPVRAAPDDLALIQYTSGSTGSQKGVALTYRNLIINNKVSGEQGNPNVDEPDRDVVQVSWLPLYHDMGLISAVLVSLYRCHYLVLMSPQFFLRDPKNWLWLIHRFRGSFTLAPNFAYSLCLKKIRDDEIQGLDLSSWRNSGCAAEPIDPVTMENFTRRFSKYGLPETAITPYYGLAELTVAATGFPVKKKMMVDVIDRERLESASIAESTTKKDAIRVVCVGTPMEGHEVKIVTDEGRELPQRHEGEIIIKGPCVMQGYYRAPEVTAHILKDGWIYSGDLGYLTEDGLYITGRKKDLIIKGGRNFYPHLIEMITQGIEGIRKGCTVVFGVPNEKTGTEDIVILAETQLNVKEYRQALQTKIRDAVLSAFQCRPDVVEILPPLTLHKTSSGKIQRSACRESYLKGFFRKKKPRAWLSLLKIYGENRIQTFRGFFQDQRWSRIWQRPLRKRSGRYPVVEDAIISLPADFGKTRIDAIPPCENFQQLLFYREQNNAAELYCHMLEGRGQQRQLTYHNVYSEAQQYAFGLRKMGVSKGNRVVVILPKKDFVTLFLGCSLIGAVPVPVQPPFRIYEIQSYIQYLVHILDDCQPSLVITFADVREITQAAILKSRHHVRHVDLESLVVSKFRKVTPANITAQDDALVYYTPGTTELPQGVTLTHANLLDNIRAIHQMLAIKKDDVLIAWITLYENSSSLASLCAFWGNFPAVLISPDWALQNPKVWLWAIHKYKGTISLAPAIFYQQASELPEEEIRGLDLSSWRAALFGSDTTIETLQAFVGRFTSCKFDKNALVSSYIPSEVGLVAALTPPPKGVPVDDLDYRRFQHQLSFNENARPRLSMGVPLPRYEIRIVDSEEKIVPEGTEGELLLHCPSLFKGHVNAPKSEYGKPGEWLCTGDMGYFRQGHIYLTGHKETLIQKNGETFYPALLEASVEQIEGVRTGAVVVMAVAEEERQEIVLLAEVQLGIRKTNYEITHEIQKILEMRFNCCPDEIVLVPPYALPRSISGALQRAMCRETYIKGNLYKRHKRMWLEMLKIYSGNRLRRIQDAVKIWQWFRTWRERRRMHDNDPDILQKEMARIIAGEMDIALSQLGPEVNLMKDLGLDSLKAIELLAIMEENFEVSIPNDSLEKYPTLARLSAYLCELRSDREKKEEIPAVVPAKSAASTKAESELLLLSALNCNALIAQIQSLLGYVARPKTSLANLCYTISTTEGNYCLALVVDSWEDLAAKLQEALEHIAAPGEVEIEDPRGIYFSSRPCDPGKIAFLFPGQGVQYPNMLQDLRRYFPVLDNTFAHFDRVWTEQGLTPLTGCICGTEGHPPQLQEIQVAQPAILVSDLAIYRLLLGLQIKPDMVAGHSYGEFIAAYAAGIFDAGTLEKIGLGAGKLARDEERGQMAMAAVATGCDKVQDVLKVVPGAIFIANKNCLVQTVIAGDKTAIEQAVQICRVIKIMAEVLPIPYAFHCPMAEPIYRDFKKSLESIPLQSPAFPIYSCMTGEEYPKSPAQISALLCEQIVNTVVFDKMVWNMYRDGARVFIEVGPRNVLSNFVRRLLQDQQCCVVSSNHHLRPGIEQLNHLLGALAARGVRFSLENFYAHRDVTKDMDILNALTLGA